MAGKRKQNALKATVVADGQGRTLWAGNLRPGRMHDATAIRGEGIEDLFWCYQQSKSYWTTAT